MPVDVWQGFRCHIETVYAETPEKKYQKVPIFVRIVLKYYPK